MLSVRQLYEELTGFSHSCISYDMIEMLQRKEERFRQNS